MFCPNCGSKVDDCASFCTQCGTNLNAYSEAPPPPAYQNQNVQPQQQQQQSATPNTVALVGFILSFFIPIAGLVCSIVGYNNSKRGMPYRGLAVAGIIISAVSMAISFFVSLATIDLLASY